MQARPHLSHCMILRNLGFGVNAGTVREAVKETCGGIDRRNPLGIWQVSGEANNSSNLPVRWIDSQANRRYSLAQIPNLVAYTNSRFGQKAIGPGPAAPRADRISSCRSSSKLNETLNRAHYTTQQPWVALSHRKMAADLFLYYCFALGASPRRRNHRTIKINRAGGRQIL